MATVIDNARFRKLLRAYPIKAMELLHDQYYKNLLHLAKSLIHDPKAAEDIVQEAFLNVWLKRVELSEEHKSSFEHYLVRVVRNIAITQYTKDKQKNSAYSELISNRPSTNENPIEKDIIQVEFMTEIRKVIETFPRTERERLLMNIDQEMTIDQIADNQRVTRKAVERSLTSARKRLRGWFNK